MNDAMKKLLLAAAVLVSAWTSYAQYRTPDYSDLYDSETVSALKGHVSMIAGAQMEGRKAGSEGERMTAEYIGRTLKEYDVELITPEAGETFGLAQPEGDTLVSRNVAAFIQGCDPALNGRYILVGARMDNLGSDRYTVDGESVNRIYYGANGNASGVALLLELARMLRSSRLRLGRSVLLVAFGASAESMAGSWYFLDRAFSDSDRIDAMVNLDMLGTASLGFYAYTSSNADMNSLVRRMEGELLPIRPELTAIEPYPSDHRAFYAKEIPSVFFTTGRYPEYGTQYDTPSLLQYDAMEKELEYIYNFTVTLSSAPRPDFHPGSEPADAEAKAAVSYHDVDYKPTFMGSADPSVFLEKWVYVYLRYPEEAVKAGNQGRVTVDFVVDEGGKVTDVSVRRGVSPALDAEAVRIVSASPKWRPGRMRGGKKVRTAITMTIEFRLERNPGFGIYGINGKKIK